MPQWTCLVHSRLNKRSQPSRVTQLTCRSVLFVWGIRRGRGRYTVNIHDFLLLQPPPFTVLFFPFPFLSEHGLQVFGSSVLILRVTRVLERFRDMEVGELLDEGLCGRVFRSVGDEWDG